jgi:hypothetical protein
MDIVKKLNPFKRFHHQTSAAPSSLFDSDVGSPAGGPGNGGLSTTGGHGGGGLRLQFHRQQPPPQQSTEPALQRLLHQRRDSERKRDARAAATEKELLHLNQKIVRQQNTSHVIINIIVTHTFELHSSVCSASYNNLFPACPNVGCSDGR